LPSLNNLFTNAGSRGLFWRALALLAVVLTVLVPVAALGMAYPPHVLRYWIFGTAGACATAWLVAARAPRAADALLLAAQHALFATGRRTFGLTVFALAFLSSAIFLFVAFRGRASSTDEIAQLWHAGVLLQGMLALDVDPNPEFFSLDTVVDRGAWYSQFPIGGPALLTIGRLIGIPAASSVLCFAAAGVAYWQLLECTHEPPIRDDEERSTVAPEHKTWHPSFARSAALLLVLAPGIAAMAGTMMNHAPAMAAIVTALMCAARWERSDDAGARSRWAMLAGLLLSVAALFRPLDAAVALLALAIFVASRRRAFGVRAGEVAAATLGLVIGVAPLLLSNAALNGTPLRFGYDVQWGAAHGLGFHEDPYGVPFTPREGATRTVISLAELNMFVTAWPVPVLLLVGVGLWRSAQWSAWDSFFLGWFGLQLLGYTAYWGEGEFLGPRFLYSVLPALIVFVTKAVSNERAESERDRRLRHVFVVACLLLTWAVPIGAFNAWELVRIARSARASLRLDVKQAALDAGLANAVVFLPEPFSARLTRRLWGVGVDRSRAARLLRAYDACSLLDAVREIEAAGVHDGERSLARLISSRSFVASDSALETTDGLLQFNGSGSFDSSCSTELRVDDLGGFVPFGSALPLLSDTPRIDDQSVVFAADLGEHNSVLTQRFSQRKWYRAEAHQRQNAELAVSFVRLR
jgi:hypothetical protein